MGRSRFLLPGLLLLVATVLAAVGGAGTARAADHTVAMGDNFFSPQTITIQVGDTITWPNQGRVVHTATFQGLFDSDILRAGQSYSFTFTSAGTFNYLCLVHPKEMTGTIVVEAGAAPTATAPSQEGAPTQPAAGSGQNFPKAGTGPGELSDSNSRQWTLAASVLLVAIAALSAVVVAVLPRKGR